MELGVLALMVEKKKKRERGRRHDVREKEK